MEKRAVIETGGKQYFVSEGEKICVEKLAEEVGKKIVFADILMTVSNDKATIGQPLVKGAKVEAKIIAHTRAKKVFGAKVKAKKRHQKYFGHKQHLTKIAITKITIKTPNSTPGV